MKVAKRAADVSWLAFTRDSTALRVCAVDSLTYQPCGSLWDTGTGHARPWPPPKVDEGACPVEHPSGRWLFGRAEKGGLAAHDLTTGRTLIESFKDRIAHVAVAPDGGTVLFCRIKWPPPTRHSYESRTWSDTAGFGPGFAAALFPRDDTGSNFDYSRGLVPLSGNKRFVTIDSSMFEPPRLAVRAITDGSVIATATAATIAADATLAVAPDGERVVVVGGPWLSVFQAANLTKPPQKIANDGRKHFTSAAFHPSGRYLAATSNDETVKLFDASSWDVIKTFTWKIGRMKGIAFSPDGTLAAAGSDKGRVVVWDLDL